MFCWARVINVRPKFLVKFLNEFQTMKVSRVGVIETHGLLKLHCFTSRRPIRSQFVEWCGTGVRHDRLVRPGLPDAIKGRDINSYPDSP
jgi:hypothetical protein